MTTFVITYDPAWPDLFREQRDILETVLAPWLSGGIHHIGSTSIPGLQSKPIIDMIAGVRDLEEARAAIGPLQEHGWSAGAHRAHEALWFHRGEGPVGHTHQLHLTEPDSALWVERLTFRDALLEDPALLREYGALKDKLANHPDAQTIYTAAKRPFVAHVLDSKGVFLDPPSPSA